MLRAVAPLGGIQVATTTELVIPALATALIGSFTSFPWTLLGALAIGIGQAEIGHWCQTLRSGSTGWPGREDGDRVGRR